MSKSFLPPALKSFTRLPHLLLALATLTGTVHAADDGYAIRDLIRSEDIKELLSGDVELHWAGEPLGEFARLARPARYTRYGLALSPLGGSRRHCVEAFQKTLTEMVKDARQHGYDTIIDVRPVVDGQPLPTADSFTCKPGYKVTTVTLVGTFAMSEAALRLDAERERRSLNVAPRGPAADSVFLPLAPMLGSPEARAVLGPTLEAHGWSPGASYRYRSGPDDYDGSAPLPPDGNREIACRQAVAKALAAIAEAARDGPYTSIINVRSRLNDDFAPQVSDLECEIRKNKANVNLQASLAADGP